MTILHSYSRVTGYCDPNVLIVLITFLRKGAYSDVKFNLVLCAAVERKARGLRGWSGVELTTQSPRCRSDDRTNVNTRLSHRKHAFASPHHDHRPRSRGDRARPFRGNFQQVYQGIEATCLPHARMPHSLPPGHVGYRVSLLYICSAIGSSMRQFIFFLFLLPDFPSTPTEHIVSTRIHDRSMNASAFRSPKSKTLYEKNFVL